MARLLQQRTTQAEVEDWKPQQSQTLVCLFPKPLKASSVPGRRLPARRAEAFVDVGSPGTPLNVRVPCFLFFNSEIKEAPIIQRV